MRKMKAIWAVLAIGSLVTITSCKKSSVEENEEELITTVMLSFTEQGTSNTSYAIFRDLDGEGGNAPSQFDPILLDAGKIYSVRITLLNEANTIPEDITDEVETEGLEHQFYYLPSGVNIIVSNLNTDVNGWPLGITSTWTTAAEGTGTVRVVLKHKPEGKGPNDSVSLGETDIDLNFQATIVP